MEFLIDCIPYLKMSWSAFMTLALAYFTWFCHVIYREKRDYGVADVLDFLVVPFFATVTLGFLWCAVGRFLTLI